MASGVQVTVRGSANIAVIKYWGKRDEKLNLPINSSLSGTLDQEQLSTVTTAYTAAELVEDELYINNERQPVSSNRRLVACLDALRAAAIAKHHDGGDALSPSWKLRIVSRNNFPTAAGLASSASGFCCLVYAVAKLWRLDDDMGFLSSIARQGSGSACRSLFGGWVRWTVGSLADGSDSRASQVADHLHWPEMRVLVLVVSDKRKDVPSTDGMQRTVATSPMIPERVRVVPERMAAMEHAILERDYEAFAHLTMLDSDHFHELCHTTEPPIHYMNDVSRAVVALVRAYNAAPGGMKVAYTFDAGPNAVLYLREQHVLPTLALLLRHFPRAAIPDAEFLSNAAQLELANATTLPELSSEIAVPTVEPDSIKYIISTRVGDGPTVLDDAHSLIDATTALPKE